ncbi:MAG: hypothetical protein KDD69_09010 [Bdellovibrionales bacterium]|nr:hypothetical protein [Bdellovibrionales bacterium]
MTLKPLKFGKKIVAGPAPTKEQLARLAKCGFKTVVNLSKKGELDQALSPEDEAEVVDELRMHYVHLPVSISSMKHDQVDALIEKMSEADFPAYFHCRIGQRATPFALLLYALQKGMTSGEALSKAEGMGVEWNAPVIRDFVASYLDRHGTEVSH